MRVTGEGWGHKVGSVRERMRWGWGAEGAVLGSRWLGGRTMLAGGQDYADWGAGAGWGAGPCWLGGGGWGVGAGGGAGPCWLGGRMLGRR